MLFFVIVLSIPVYGYAIWSLYEPEESFLFLERWRYKEPPEISDTQIKLIRIGSVIIIIIWTIIVIATAIDTFTPDPPVPYIDNW
ncbi:hypothetical protein [Oceanobacillus kapialis]|uniref:DUF6199 domain-containing protein n=1 Tax=Oceanobacillus kapialis TaxID=481353 RepID=A0ABW5Q336_9BACI